MNIEEIMNKAVDKFLGWELPDFYPDGGITFKRIPNHTAIGTHLFSAIEAKAMFEYALSDTITTLLADCEARVKGEAYKFVADYKNKYRGCGMADSMLALDELLEALTPPN